MSLPVYLSVHHNYCWPDAGNTLIVHNLTLDLGLDAKISIIAKIDSARPPMFAPTFLTKFNNRNFHLEKL